MRFPFGGELQRLDIAFEVYGHLNEKRDNAILLGCGVSASSHAKSHPHNRETGWWEGFIGPGKALDTNRFFIICIANLGGCSGTSGPSSFIPQQQQKKPPEPAADNEIRYGLNFPWFTVQDMARVQLRVIDRLQIGRLHAAVGSSLGALQMADPAFACGNYYGKKYPSVGMRLARQVATITYRSGPEWMLRFGRLRVPGAHQTSSKGEVLGEEKQGAMDLFSLARRDPHTGTSSLVYGVRNLQMPVLVMGVHSDLLFPLEQQIEIKDTLRKAGNKMVSFYSLDSIYGHDTFLIDVTNVGAGVKGHLEQEFDTNHSAQYLGQSKIEYQPEQGMALLPMAPTGKKPEQDTFRGPVDFVSANREAVSMLECKKPKQKTPKGQFSRHKNFGVIPRYVKALRTAAEQKGRSEEKGACDDTLPLGVRRLPEAERQKLLSLVVQQQKEAEKELSLLPIALKTERQRKRHEELLRQLLRVDSYILKLSSKNVLIEETSQTENAESQVWSLTSKLYILSRKLRAISKELRIVNGAKDKTRDSMEAEKMQNYGYFTSHLKAEQ
ncbi:homoserine o-acetyltransferase [Cyclospora cayetanensis]|uniref:Homoserine o-acetyltransferase n=1 Tax=Cyclospora cayetanensis TaxID=88456 RepID=A0A1D3CTK1_9EIME|nr:homoserine o-acetyltransferase [Cyclospora cayetanensis]